MPTTTRTSRSAPWLRLRRLALLSIHLMAVSMAAAQTAQTAQGPRVALVVGNAAYRDAALANPVNDARAMALALREAGFQVVLRTDISQRELVTAVREFGDRLRGASTGLFYFAGHGMQIKGRNYLVPVGAEIQREDEVAYAALDAQAVLDKMESAGNGHNLVILDACRNNPFSRSFRSASQGLAQMDAPVGTMIAFATAPGSVASDGSGPHGLYTKHLLAQMRQPGAKVEDVFKRVRSAVRRESEGRQVPWEATSLEGDMTIFAAAPQRRPGPRPSAGTPSHPPQTVPAVAPAAPAVELPTTTDTALQADHDRRTAELLAEMQARPAATGSPSVGPRPVGRDLSHGYRVGDRWNYQVSDRKRGEVVRNYTLRVARLLPDGGWTTPGNSHFDAEGRLVETETADGEKRRHTPHVLRWWAGMMPGEQKQFEVEVLRTPRTGAAWKQLVSSDARVVGIERVRVPAGEYMAWRIEHKGSTRNVGSYGYGTFTTTVWYVPELLNYAAIEHLSHWNGQLESDMRDELTSAELSTRAR